MTSGEGTEIEEENFDRVTANEIRPRANLWIAASLIVSAGNDEGLLIAG